MALEEFSEIVQANTKDKPSNPTYSFRNNEIGKTRYVTFYYSPNIFAAPEGIVQLNVGDVESFAPNAKGALAQRAQLPLAVSVPIKYGQKINFYLWSEVDDPMQIGGSIFVQISDNEAPLPTPKNIDFDGLVRLAKNIEIFPYQPYRDTEVTKLLNMEGHKEGILTLAPTRTISDHMNNKILDIITSAEISYFSRFGLIYFQKNQDQKLEFYIDEGGSKGRTAQITGNSPYEITSYSQESSIELYEIEFDLKNQDLKSIRIEGDSLSDIIFSKSIESHYAPDANQSGGFRNFGTFQILATLTELEIAIIGEKDGVWTVIDADANLPFELADTEYGKIRLELSFRVVLTMSISTTHTTSHRSKNGYDERVGSLIASDEKAEDFQPLADVQTLIPSHTGGVLQLSIEVKSASGQWLEHVPAATLAALITDSNGRAILSAEKLNGAILPSTSDSLRVKMITTGNVETGVSVILS